jgi:hypothetical protein
MSERDAPIKEITGYLVCREGRTNKGDYRLPRMSERGAFYLKLGTLTSNNIPFGGRAASFILIKVTKFSSFRHG